MLAICYQYKSGTTYFKSDSTQIDTAIKLGSLISKQLRDYIFSLFELVSLII